MAMTVTVTRYTTDRYGDRIVETTFQVHQCGFAPRVTREVNDRSSQVTAEAELYVPAGADIRASDVVTLADNTDWEVQGRPENWDSSPWDEVWSPGTVVPLTRVTG